MYHELFSGCFWGISRTFTRSSGLFNSKTLLSLPVYKCINSKLINNPKQCSDPEGVGIGGPAFNVGPF